MARLAQIANPEVKARPLSPGYQDSTNATPATFGAGIGQAVANIGEQIGQIATQERRSAAQFAAADAELKFGAELDAAVLEFKNLGGLAPVQQIGDFEARLEKARAKARESLTDPLAQEKYEMATRVQMQAGMRHLNAHADEQIDVWKDGVVTGKIAQAEQKAGLVTGDVKADLRNIGEAALGFEGDLRTRMQEKGIASELADAKVHDTQAKLIDAALEGYVGKKDPNGGLRLLNSVFPGTDLSVREVLGGKAAGKWEAHFGSLGQAERVEREGAAVWAQASGSAFDPVTKRFDEDTARTVFAGLPAETRALVEKDFNDRIHVANHLQERQDVERLGRIAKSIRAQGRLDKTSIDYRNLDDIGQAKAEGMWDTYVRQHKADKASAREEQRQANAAARGEMYTMLSEPGGVDRVAKLTDDDLDATFPEVDDVGLRDLKAARKAAFDRSTHGQSATLQEFGMRVSDAVRSIKSNTSDKKTAEKFAADFHQRMFEWYTSAPSDKPRSDQELAKKLGEELLRYKYPFYQSDKYGFQMTDAEKAAHAPSPIQPFAEAQKELAARAGKKKIKVDLDGNIVGAK